MCVCVYVAKPLPSPAADDDDDDNDVLAIEVFFFFRFVCSRRRDARQHAKLRTNCKQWQANATAYFCRKNIVNDIFYWTDNVEHRSLPSTTASKQSRRIFFLFFVFIFQLRNLAIPSIPRHVIVSAIFRGALQTFQIQKRCKFSSYRIQICVRVLWHRFVVIHSNYIKFSASHSDDDENMEAEDERKQITSARVVTCQCFWSDYK